MILCEAFGQLIDNGVARMADSMKMLLYHESRYNFDKIEFSHDRAFLEPLLFLYLNSNKKYPIDNVLSRYFKSVIPINEKIEAKLTDGDLVYLSNGLEVCTRLHPLWAERFKNNNEIVEVEIEKTTQLHIDKLQNAFEIIAIHLPQLHEEILKTNRKIVLFYNPNVRCFVTIEAHGMIFLSTIPENDEVFFLEEIIHQCSHNTFNCVLFGNESDFFKIDIQKEILGDFIGNEAERRTIYSAMHGLYTVAKRYESFEKLIQKNIFVGKNRHEFLGRFGDLKKRFRTGLEKLNHDSIFTERGMDIYNTLDNFCFEAISRIDENQIDFDFSNQPAEFSYSKFLELNPLS
ncbi:MAG: hypothetical protein ORN54_11725 [Cyclobacteriaceae bacterium]|nr:hypothetical protein [Cyclobacteriaceae bacterium]